MESQNSRELRMELECLLEKQSKSLEDRLAGRVNETEILKYELRQEAIREMWERLSDSATS